MTVAGHRLARQHQQHQIALGAAAVGLFAGLLDRVRSGDLTEEQFLALYTATQQAAFTTSAQAAMVFVTDFRTIQDPDTTHAAPVQARFDTQQGLARSTTALDELRRADAAAQATIINRLAAGLQRHVLAGGRETVQASAFVNGAGWRRITDSNPCAFCAMLALNTYDTRAAASQVTGRHRRRRPLGAAFHDHCGCTVVEAVGDWEDDAQVEQYRELYDNARAACEQQGLQPTTANIQAQMREHGHGIINDAHVPEGQRKKPGPKPQAGGAGGNGDGGRKPPRMPSADAPQPRKPKRGGREPRERTAADYDYWQSRQDALPFETTGAVMKPHEIEFAEAFIADGHTILRWLPQGGVDSTGRIATQSDFEWEPGRLVELKRTGKSGTMKRYIKDNLAKGKRIFMADFGDIRPATKEVRSLRKFMPDGNPDFELWAYWDGHLERLQ